MSTGVTLFVDTLRVTELQGALAGDVPIFGEHLIRKNLVVSVTPVIKTGVTKGSRYERHKAPDTFERWEFKLKTKRFRYLWNYLRPDKELERLLHHHCAFEFWTTSMVGEGKDFHQDPDYGWIHWLFPSTSWLRDGRGRWKGRSYSEGPRMKPEDFPDDTLALTDGGWWKTAAPPPR